MKEILNKGKISVLTSDLGDGGWSKEAHIAEYKGMKYAVRKCKTLKRAKSYEELEKIFGEKNILPKFLGREGKNVFYEYIKGRDLRHKETKDVIYQVGQIAGHINDVKIRCGLDKRFETHIKELFTGDVASEHKRVYIENKKSSIITNPRPMISKEEYKDFMDFYKTLKGKVKPQMALDANDINPSNFRLREGKVYFVDVEAIKQRVKGFGIGKAFNGGYGLVLDGSKRVDEVIKYALEWDVMGGVARRSWARNENSIKIVNEWNENNKERGHITIPFIADNSLIDKVINESI